MRTRKVLFPTELGEVSAKALDMATSMARDRGATVLVLHVAQSTPVAAGEAYYAMAEPNVQKLLAELEHIRPTDATVPCEHRIETGDTIAAIIHVAKQEECDLIVMATHGRQGLSRFFMGSIAEEVLRRAPCPVLTVKHQAEEPALA